MLILTFFETDSSLSSHDVVGKLEREKRSSVSIRAVQMALMRYCEQGLLHRERQGGRFLYVLTEKGTRRLLWLKGIVDQR